MVRLRAEERSAVVVAHIGVGAADVAAAGELRVVFGLVGGSSCAGSRWAAVHSVAVVVDLCNISFALHICFQCDVYLEKVAELCEQSAKRQATVVFTRLDVRGKYC